MYSAHKQVDCFSCTRLTSRLTVLVVPGSQAGAPADYFRCTRLTHTPVDCFRCTQLTHTPVDCFRCTQLIQTFVDCFRCTRLTSRYPCCWRVWNTGVCRRYGSSWRCLRRRDTATWWRPSWTRRPYLSMTSDRIQHSHGRVSHSYLVETILDTEAIPVCDVRPDTTQPRSGKSRLPGGGHTCL